MAPDALDRRRRRRLGDVVPELRAARIHPPAKVMAAWPTAAMRSRRPRAFAIVVPDASDRMAPFHDREPVLLRGVGVGVRPSGEAGPGVLPPGREDAPREWVASSRVDRTGDGGGPTLLDPAGEAA